jgi:rhodanese-related sulfurtransferase
MDINVQELKQRLDAGDNKFIFIDVREPYEYEEFNLGATLIPLGDVPAKIEELEGFRSEEIIIHCRSGKRSATAQSFLQTAGFTNVRNLEGGVLAWIDSFGVVKP